MSRYNNATSTYYDSKTKQNRSKNTAHDIFVKLQNSSFEGAAIFDNLGLLMHNYKKNRTKQFHFQKLDQKVITYNLGVSLPDARTSLYPTFKWKIQQLIQGGFFDQWLKPYLKDQSVVEKELEEDKVVLTMDHLSVGFTIWLAMLLISLLGFIGERITIHVLNYFRAMLLRRLNFVVYRE